MNYDDFDLEFFKETGDKIWQVLLLDKKTHEKDIGTYCFSFDKKKIFNFWTDYPEKLTRKQIEI